MAAGISQACFSALVSWCRLKERTLLVRDQISLNQGGAGACHVDSLAMR